MPSKTRSKLFFELINDLHLDLKRPQEILSPQVYYKVKALYEYLLVLGFKKQAASLNNDYKCTRKFGCTVPLFSNIITLQKYLTTSPYIGHLAHIEVVYLKPEF